jgi:outer membrane protein assembly factor BamB
MHEHTRGARPALRLWPGVVIVTLQWLITVVLPVVKPDLGIVGVIGGVAGGFAVLLWWLLFSRARWLERLGAIAAMVVALLLTWRVVDASISNGMMGMMLPVYATPLLSLALVAWAAGSRRLSGAPRLAALAGAIAVACGVMTLLRTGGISGEGVSDLHWRWTSTPEERLLARGEEPASIPSPAATPVEKDAAATPAVAPAPEPAAAVAGKSGAPASADEQPAADSAAAIVHAEWPGFRGPERDGVVHGARIATDWTQSPPVPLWRQPIGPGWSSFAVHGRSVYTQEQRGAAEIVSAYDLTTGAPGWKHRDAARFWESNGGAGPRGTPTFSNGRLYTFGATGVLNALDARTGAVVWSRNAASDTHKKVPEWGFASSPAVIGGTVVIATAGTLAAYDAATGAPRWIGPNAGGGYSSPQLATIDGVEQIVLANTSGALAVTPADGKLLWKHDWSSDGIVQPAILGGRDVLLGNGSGLNGEVGVRRVAVAHGPAGWTADERWTSSGLKPYFNDFVVHAGHAYGFDGSILACIDLADGRRVWKGGRYGHGQLILLPEQDLLIVLSEEGELALVKATADRFTELARVPALEGKTWNHPVLVDDVLLVRNGEEMAAFRLARADR